MPTRTKPRLPRLSLRTESRYYTDSWRLGTPANAREESLNLPESSESGSQTRPQWPAPAEPTADESVNSIVADLTQIPDLSVGEHERVYQRIHDGLLADLETEAD
jgi:hypothetical protein